MYAAHIPKAYESIYNLCEANKQLKQNRLREPNGHATNPGTTAVTSSTSRAVIRNIISLLDGQARRGEAR
jgi:hypothetical protein